MVLLELTPDFFHKISNLELTSKGRPSIAVDKSTCTINKITKLRKTGMQYTEE